MSSLFGRLWRLEGTISRSTYVTGGVIAFALKYAIDWSIATLIFHRTWTPLSYWRMVGLQNDRVTVWMFLLLLVVSLPFLWFGMSMTLLRLRDARRSAGWAALFFVPVINAVLFVALSILPPRSADIRDLSGVMESALFATVTAAALATAAIGLSTRGLETYGIGLFVAIPFCVGYLSAFLHGRRYPTRVCSRTSSLCWRRCSSADFCWRWLGRA